MEEMKALEKKPNLGFSGQAQRKYICWMQMVFAIK